MRTSLNKTRIEHEDLISKHEAFKKRIDKTGVHKKRSDETGQATVEAAFLIPTLLLTLLMLIQPAILLYTRMVMEGAAAEGCRVLATESALEQNTETVEDFIKRRLASVPQQESFHVHQPDCTWIISKSGNENASEVSVEISNEIRPLPLFDFGLAALGVLNENGNYQLKVSKQLKTKAAWVQASGMGNDPEQWISRWQDS